MLLNIFKLLYNIFKHSGLDKTDEVKTTGYGNLGMIDNKDVPSLVLQIILCKYGRPKFITYLTDINMLL